MSKQYVSSSTTARLEAEINNSPVFYIKDKSSAAYKKARKELIKNLYNLTLEAGNYTQLSFDKNLELVAAADSCAERFDPKKGNFVHYFNATFSGNNKNSYSSDKKQKLLTVGSASDCDNGITPESSLDYIANRYGSEELADEYFTEDIFEEYGVADIVACISRAYEKQQLRTRSLFSHFATGLIFDCVDERLVYKCNIMTEPFFNREYYDSLYGKESSLSQRELAVMFGREESNISRSFKTFKKTIRDEFDNKPAA